MTSSNQVSAENVSLLPDLCQRRERAEKGNIDHWSSDGNAINVIGFGFSRANRLYQHIDLFLSRWQRRAESNDVSVVTLTTSVVDRRSSFSRNFDALKLSVCRHRRKIRRLIWKIKSSISIIYHVVSTLWIEGISEKWRIRFNQNTDRSVEITWSKSKKKKKKDEED